MLMAMAGSIPSELGMLSQVQDFRLYLNSLDGACDVVFAGGQGGREGGMVSGEMEWQQQKKRWGSGSWM